MHCGNEFTFGAQGKAVDDDESMKYMKKVLLGARRSILIM